MTFCPAELERFGGQAAGSHSCGHRGAQADARRVDDVDLDALLVEFFLARPAVRIAEIRSLRSTHVSSGARMPHPAEDQPGDKCREWKGFQSPRCRRPAGTVDATPSRCIGHCIGPTMSSHAELAYTGIVETLGALDREFALRAQAAPGDEPSRALDVS